MKSVAFIVWLFSITAQATVVWEFVAWEYSVLRVPVNQDYAETISLNTNGVYRWQDGDTLRDATITEINAATAGLELPGAEVAPRLIPEGIEVPSFILTDQTTGVGYEFRVNSQGDLVGGVTNHASPRRPKSDIDADFEKQDQADKAMKREARTVRTNMTALIQAIKPMVDNKAWTNTGQQAQSEQIEFLLRNLEKAMKEIKDLSGVDLQQLREAKD